MSLRSIRLAALILGVLGVGVTLFFHWLVFFWVSTEATLGVVQRIFYLHVASAWVAFLAFGIVALCSAVYLWLGDEKLDQAARSAAEGGMVFTTIVLIAGSLWARISWGIWWTWDPRLTLTLLLWFIYLGHFMVRNATESPERGKKFAAVVGLVGALNIPLIHVSVLWFRSLHPQPVVARTDGPQLPSDMITVLFVALFAFTLVFFSLFLLRYAVARLEERAAWPTAPTST
ncbi:MAG: cytochrome C assembly protein [Gemmatimonadetes bacterium]|nr:cytochrome C assembly protein [Gemmatimonadota bacterium]